MQSTIPRSYGQIQPEERIALASLVHQKFTAREIAQVLNRAPSTITRELKRNAQGPSYASQAAMACAAQRRIQGRAAKKLHDDGAYCAGGGTP